MALPMKHSPAPKSKSLLISMLIILVVFAEIAFLSRLDMAKNAAIVHTWTKSFITASVVGFSSDSLMAESEDLEELGVDSCEDWLKREDLVSYDRDFNEDPIWVSGGENEWRSCSVGCNFGSNTKPDKRPDAVFGLGHDSSALNVLRSMESSQYYSDNNIDHARRKGFHIVMTTSLSSDVPVGYFSWAEYDIMSPFQSKTEEALAAAFISNCGARNFRLEALTMLENMKIKIDSYGACHRNRDGRAVDKVETLKKYKFSLAFENSNEEDYVTEKFFQSLVAGSVPVVVGAPNILEFAPSPVSVLHIKTLDDVDSVGKRMLDLASNPQAYNESLRWKYDGPSDSFKALVDMAAVHSSCRLCIHLATLIQDKEEKSNPTFQKRPCKCVRGGETVYHLFVRERGRFELKSIFLRSSNLTLAALTSEVYTKFKSENHVPVWKNERPEVLRGGNWKVYKIYPVGLTQRQALYNFKFDGDGSLREYVESHPCSKLEVVFV